MNALALLCKASCCLALLTAGHAAYEEQAEQHSWYQQYIGRVEKALYAFKGRDRVFVSTAKSVIASLDLKDGRIVWRQVLLPEDRVEAIALMPKPAAVVSLSRRGQSLRAWHAGDGTLIWENTLGSSEVGDSGAQYPGQVLVLSDITGDGSTDIAVLSSNKLQV
jgi:outer membrane protein assembly factor BamB